MFFFPFVFVILNLFTNENATYVTCKTRYIYLTFENVIAAWRLLYLRHISPGRFLTICGNIIGPQTVDKIDHMTPDRVAALLTLEQEFQEAVLRRNNG